jgi:hypothetical protein
MLNNMPITLKEIALEQCGHFGCIKNSQRQGRPVQNQQSLSGKSKKGRFGLGYVPNAYASA